MMRTPPRLTAVGSGKGGTGKTVLSLMLAHAFAARGERVLLVDADLGLANAAVQLGLSHGGDLPGLIAGHVGLADAIATVEAGGFDLIAAPPGSGKLSDPDERIAERLLAPLLHAHGYARIVIDLPAGIGACTMALAAHADDTLAIATPDPAALTDAYAFVKLMARRTGGRLPALVVNRAGSAIEAKRTADTVIRASRSFLKRAPEYLGFIPEDAKVGEAVRRQSALFAYAPTAPAAKAVTALAEVLCSEHEARCSVPSLR